MRLDHPAGYRGGTPPSVRTWGVFTIGAVAPGGGPGITLSVILTASKLVAVVTSLPASTEIISPALRSERLSVVSVKGMGGVGIFDATEEVEVVVFCAFWRAA